MRQLPGYERFQILRKAADLLLARQKELGRLISLEEGKTLAEGVFEVTRAAETIELSAEEAKRLGGEVLPLDGAPGGAGKLGFTIRVPCGVVVAITPFNFPLNLVCHKVGPALAGGNAVDRQAGERHAALGAQAGRDPARSGPAAVGDCLPHGQRRRAGQGAVPRRARAQDQLHRQRRGRRADLRSRRHQARDDGAGQQQPADRAGRRRPRTKWPTPSSPRAIGNAGQVCIFDAARDRRLDSVYRRLARRAQAARRRRSPPATRSTKATKMGPMIRERDAVRVGQWIDEAVQQGARLVAGGGRGRARCSSRRCWPTCSRDAGQLRRAVRPGGRRHAGAATSTRRSGWPTTRAYGLSAGIFTQDIDAAMRFAREVDAGNLHINWGPPGGPT